MYEQDTFTIEPLRPNILKTAQIYKEIDSLNGRLDDLKREIAAKQSAQPPRADQKPLAAATQLGNNKKKMAPLPERFAHPGTTRTPNLTLAL